MLEGADLAAVLPPTVAGVLANSGQSCIAPTRLLVHASQVGDATQIVKTMMEATQVGDPSVMGELREMLTHPVDILRESCVVALHMYDREAFLAAGVCV